MSSSPFLIVAAPFLVFVVVVFLSLAMQISAYRAVIPPKMYNYRYI